MKRGLPLSVKAMLWALLNLALLAGLGWGLFRGQIGPGLDSLMAGRAGDRLQGMADVLAGELARSPEPEWETVLERTAAAYELKLIVLRPDGRRWGGEGLEVPGEVTGRIRERIPPDFRNRPGSRREREREPGGLNPGGRRPDLSGPPERSRDFPPGGPPGSGPDKGDLPGDRTAPGPGGPPEGLRHGGDRGRFLVRAGDPPRYWAGLMLRGLPPADGRPGFALLLAVSDSLTAGGWLVDPLPWLLGGFGAVLLSVLLWYPVFRSVTRSVRDLTAATERMAEGKFDTAVRVTRRDELGRLGVAVNHLSGRLDHFVNGQRRFLGDIAHELNSPLARLQLGASLMERDADDRQRERLGDVQEEVVLMTGLVNELLIFAKAGLQAKSAELRAVNLADLADEVLSREAGTGDGETGVLDVPPGLTVLAEPDLLGRALGNLVRNARRYAGQAGPVCLSAREDGDLIAVTVSDEGPGVPEEELERIFEPFYRPDSARTREAGGTGLGLAIVRTCVEACQGTVIARNRKPSGLEVVIRLRPV